jgi:hypothetical protein
MRVMARSSNDEAISDTRNGDGFVTKFLATTLSIQV